MHVSSNVYIRAKDPKTGKFGPILFEDLSENEQKEYLDNLSEDQLKRLTLILSTALKQNQPNGSKDR